MSAPPGEKGLAGRRPRRKFVRRKASGSEDDSQIMDWYATELDRRFRRQTGCRCSWCRSPIGNRQFRHHGVYSRYTVRLLRRAKARRRRGMPEPLD